jgi:hypothetical protein
VVYEKSDESIKSNVSSGSCLISERTKLHFVDYVFYFLFSWIITHSPHKIRKLINWYGLRVELSSLCCVFLFRTNYTVIEEIIHILKSLSFAATLNQINKWFNAVSTHRDCLFNWSNVNSPHVNSQVSATTSKNVLAIT